jgi:hypothetical protein
MFPVSYDLPFPVTAEFATTWPKSRLFVHVKCVIINERIGNKVLIEMGAPRFANAPLPNPTGKTFLQG